MDLPHISSDGSHAIPVTRVHCVNRRRHTDATGELRWHPESGAHFRADFPGVSHTELPQYFRRSDGNEANGRKPEWIAETADGLAVSVGAINSVPVSTIETGTAGQRSYSHVEVEVSYACVDLSKGNPLSHWHCTAPHSRMLCLGFGCHHWATIDEVTIQQKNGTATIGRGTIELQREPLIQLVACGQHNLPREVGACWIVAAEQSDGLDYPLRTETAFVSFLNGRRTGAVWHDRFLNSDLLRRTYYGWRRTPFRDLDTSYSQPLPLYGTVDSIRHAKEVVPKLPGLFRAFAALANDVRFTWILNPLWSGASDLLDDRFAHACISLERLAEMWSGRREKENRPKAFTSTQVSAIQQALREAVLTLNEPLGLDAMQQELLDKKINSICSPTNVDKLGQVFRDLGIALAPDDVALLRDRNFPLHGRPTLIYSSDSCSFDTERDRTDRLHTLISQALLRLLDYRGPYINFASRGATHVEYL